MGLRPWLQIDSNLKDTASRFRTTRLEMRGQASRQIADDMGEIVRKAVHDEAPEGRTGQLRKTLYTRVGLASGGFSRGGYWVASIYSPEKYTKWVIEGRGWVRPVRAKVLHWISKSGEDVFSMYARPTQPNPFHERGLRRAFPAMRSLWGDFAHSSIEQLAD